MKIIKKILSKFGYEKKNKFVTGKYNVMSLSLIIDDRMFEIVKEIKNIDNPYEDWKLFKSSINKSYFNHFLIKK